ncbi:PTPRU-like protein [Mya arenaria]|uniref:protein-tyrosine-phosphatase n=1 Tax=Mya arenaria TaxID=6604 RepID=A0ABY7FQX8_MYAAR|nr:PTPRU-like protein [Mya arenaria]
MLVKGFGGYSNGKWSKEFNLFKDDHEARGLHSCNNVYPERGNDVCADIIEIEINPAKQLSLINITTPSYLTLCEVKIFEVACRVPDAPEHGMYLYPHDTVLKRYAPFNSVIVGSCDTGYPISNSSSALRTCLQSGFFDGSDFECTTNCQIPHVENGFYSTNSQQYVNDKVPYGTIIQPNCIKGYSIARGNNRTCQEDGQFSGGDSNCTIVTCSSFGKLGNGTLHYNDGHTMNQYADGSKSHPFGVKVTASCVSGFQLVHGSKEQTCSENGTWDGVKPVCGKIKCNDTSILSVRFQKSASVFSFLERGTALYNSNNFYLVNASVCKLQHKDNLIVNTNGCLQKDTCKIGNRVSYDCVGDYEASVKNASCQADHTWSAEPICTYHAQSTKAATIGASVGGITVVIVVVTVILVIYRQRRKAAKLSRDRRYKRQIENDGKPSNDYSELNELQIVVPKGTEEYAYATDMYEEEFMKEQSYYSFENRKKIPETAIGVDDLYEVVLSPDYVDTMKNQFEGYNRTRAFIASQGPTNEILVDFWRMVWETKSGKIVMLTNLTEEKKAEAEKRKIYQFHFTAWPDKSVPKYASSLVHFRHKVDTTTVKWKGPVIVHCSAGIGRTGTFLALSFLAEQASMMGYVDPVGCVNTLRRQRVDMVQTPDQYIFLHMALLETLMLSTSALPASSFLGAYEELLFFDKDRKKIDVEFSRMEKMSPVGDECQYVSAKEVRNRNKNRYSNILPDADHMPHLTPSGKKSEPDYINAVFLPGYKKKGAFIVTQTPLEATKTDFWRMIVEHDVRTIVMMNNRSEMKEGEIYWPENEDPEAFEHITIFTTGEECGKGLRTISLGLKRFGKTRGLQQIQFESWPAGSALPSSPKDVLNLLDAVQYWQHQSGNNPVLRMKIEQDVAITQVIKEMRNYREQIIPSLEQFQFVHEVVKEYILQNETYSNFTD